MRRVAWGCGRTGGVAPSTPGRPVDELEADFSPASGSELGWAENAVGAARAQRRCAERAERAAAENGRARRAWVDGDGVPVGHTGRPRNGNEGEGLPDDRRRRSGPRTARGRPRRGGESRELDSRGRVCGGAARCARCCPMAPDCAAVLGDHHRHGRQMVAARRATRSGTAGGRPFWLRRSAAGVPASRVAADPQHRYVFDSTRPVV